MWFAHVWNWFVKLCVFYLCLPACHVLLFWDVFNCFEMLWFWCVVHWFSYETETITCIIKVRKFIDLSPLKVVHLLNHRKFTFLLLREPLLLCYHQDHWVRFALNNRCLFVEDSVVPSGHGNEHTINSPCWGQGASVKQIENIRRCIN